MNFQTREFLRIALATALCVFAASLLIYALCALIREPKPRWHRPELKGLVVTMPPDGKLSLAMSRDERTWTIIEPIAEPTVITDDTRRTLVFTLPCFEGWLHIDTCATVPTMGTTTSWVGTPGKAGH